MLRLFVYERDSKPDPLLYVPNPDRVKLYLSVTKQVAREAASSELPYKIVVQKGQLASFPQEVKNFAQEAGITIAETLKAVK